MLSLVSTIVLGLLASAPVLGAFVGTNNKLASGTTGASLNRGDAIQYSNSASTLHGKVAFGLDGGCVFQFYYYSLGLGGKDFQVPGLTYEYNNFYGFTINPNGTLTIASDQGFTLFSAAYTTTAVRSELELARVNDSFFEVKVNSYNSAGGLAKTHQLTNTSLPQYVWAFNMTAGHAGTPQSLVTSKSTQNWGAGVKIYSLDGLFDQAMDYAGQFGTYTVNQVDPTNTDWRPEHWAHAKDLGLLVKSTNFGIAGGAAIESVRIVEPMMNYFMEPMFMRAAQYVLNDTFTGPKIVSFAGKFHITNQTRIKCATEILFKQGITVIQAGGNLNEQWNDYNPYAFTVGAGCINSACVGMTRGAALHIWAPAFIFSPNSYGSSIATGYTAAVAAAYISNKGTALSKKPGLVYQYLRDTSRTDVIPASDPYANAAVSPNALNRFLTYNPAPGVGTVQDSRINKAPYLFCSNIGISGDLSNVNTAKSAMASLIPLAETASINRTPGDPLVDGYLVNSFSYPTGSGGTTKPTTP